MAITPTTNTKQTKAPTCAADLKYTVEAKEDGFSLLIQGKVLFYIGEDNRMYLDKNYNDELRDLYPAPNVVHFCTRCWNERIAVSIA